MYSVCSELGVWCRIRLEASQDESAIAGVAECSVFEFMV